MLDFTKFNAFMFLNIDFN